MSVLKEGDLAPNFSLPSPEGEISLSDFKNKKNVVLYFYPKDQTPGCTQEACDFRDLRKRMDALDAVVIGLSADSVESHQKFKDKWKLSFALVSDEDKSVIKKYGVWKEKVLYGRKFMGIERSTFLIDKKGKIRNIFRKVRVKGHGDAVVEALKMI